MSMRLFRELTVMSDGRTKSSFDVASRLKPYPPSFIFYYESLHLFYAQTLLKCSRDMFHFWFIEHKLTLIHFTETLFGNWRESLRAPVATSHATVAGNNISKHTIILYHIIYYIIIFNKYICNILYI